MQHENDLKGTCRVIKEVIEKKKVISHFPNMLIIDNKEITNTSLITEKLIIIFLTLDQN